jgi:hypothetical protein
MTTGTGGGGPAEGGIDAPACAYGQIICDGSYAKVCDGQGPNSFAHVIHCKSDCKDGTGCVECVPNTGACDPRTKLATACDATGTYTLSFACDRDDMTCDPDGCHGVCSPGTLGMSNVGCDFWSTVTPTSVWGNNFQPTDRFHFGLVIGNTSTTAAADVTITIPGLGDRTLPPLMPNEVATTKELLPWVYDLKGDDWQTPYQPKSPAHSATLPDVNAYHVVSNQPIVVYQFSPLDTSLAANPGCPTLAGAPGCFSYSSDASLLLPTHALFKASYVVTGYHGWHQDSFPPGSSTPTKLDMGDFVSITATQPTTPSRPGTTVTMILRDGQTPLPWADGRAVVTGVPISMGPGQVMQVFSKGSSVDETLSGLQILSDGWPIQVLSGVNCASIPLNPWHCSHIEDTVVPKEALGKEYVVPVLQGQKGKMPHTIRVQAIASGTAIAFEPPLLTAVTLSSGDVVEIPDVAVDVRISANVPFAVTQFVQGPGTKDDPTVGGPSQVAVVATSQFETSYAFAAGPNYLNNFVTIVAPTGAAVTLDGHPIDSSNFMAVGASGMSVAHSPLNAQNDKLHVVSADKPVGVVVNGYTSYASYAYPAGLDLRHVASPR